MEKEWSIAPRVFLEVSSLGRGQARGIKIQVCYAERRAERAKRRKMNENWSCRRQTHTAMLARMFDVYKESSGVNCNQKRDGGRRVEERRPVSDG